MCFSLESCFCFTITVAYLWHYCFHFLLRMDTKDSNLKVNWIALTRDQDVSCIRDSCLAEFLSSREYLWMKPKKSLVDYVRNDVFLLERKGCIVFFFFLCFSALYVTLIFCFRYVAFIVTNVQDTWTWKGFAEMPIHSRHILCMYVSGVVSLSAFMFWWAFCSSRCLPTRLISSKPFWSCAHKGVKNCRRESLHSEGYKCPYVSCSNTYHKNTNVLWGCGRWFICFNGIYSHCSFLCDESVEISDVSGVICHCPAWVMAFCLRIPTFYADGSSKKSSLACRIKEIRVFYGLLQLKALSYADGDK